MRQIGGLDSRELGRSEQASGLVNSRLDSAAGAERELVHCEACAA